MYVIECVTRIIHYIIYNYKKLYNYELYNSSSYHMYKLLRKLRFIIKKKIAFYSDINILSLHIHFIED